MITKQQYSEAIQQVALQVVNNLEQLPPQAQFDVLAQALIGASIRYGVKPAQVAEFFVNSVIGAVGDVDDGREAPRKRSIGFAPPEKLDLTEEQEAMVEAALRRDPEGKPS